MSYQSVIRDASGNLVKSLPVGIRISILQGSATGTEVYKEIFNPNPQTNENGLVSIEIGSGIPVTGTFATIDWSTGTYFIKTETDPTGSTNYTISGTSQLLSVPYSLFSNNVYLNKDGKVFTLYVADKDGLIAIPKILVEKPYSAVPTVIDIDGNSYGTVKIGTQVWMAENLKTTKYRNGNLIGTTTPSTLDISGESSPKYQWAYNGNESNVSIYGRLYTWYAVTDVRNVCPTDWHLPTDAEWTTLTNYLGSMSGGRLKESGTAHWQEPNIDAINDSNFSALPGSMRSEDGTFGILGWDCYWWSSTEDDADNAWSRDVSCFSNDVRREELGTNKRIGAYVRCLKD
jgi:uncharacterized protein (TIGR02145 family)